MTGKKIEKMIPAHPACARLGKPVAALVAGTFLHLGYLAVSIAYFSLPVTFVALAVTFAGILVYKYVAGDHDPADALKNCPPSPLILDLDGDGVEADGIAFFDHEGDGWNELSRWANEDDGVLVWDRNGDGIINDGSELFGDSTALSNGATAANGFAALSDLDGNGDGVVDVSDAAWADLRVMRWTDDNDDGIMQDDERNLVTLASLGIAALNTGYTTSDHVDESGNEHRQVGSFTKADGTTATMTDVWFVTSTSHATYDRSNIPAHSEAIEALPDMVGRGRVYSLRDAMALDDAHDEEGNSRLTAPFYGSERMETRSLREMVAAFTATDEAGAPVLDQAAREVLAEKILLRWAGAEDVQGGRDFGWSNFQNSQPYKVAIVEALQGEQWLGGSGYRHPTLATGQKVDRIYKSYLERLYGQLMLQSHLSDLSGAITAALNEGAKEGSVNSEDYSLDFSGVKTLLANESDARRPEFLRSLAAVLGNDEWVLSAMRASSSAWVYEYQYYAEYLNYALEYGAGHDRISAGDFYSDANNGIKVASGIAATRVTLSRIGADLVVSLLDADSDVDSSLTVTGYYSNTAPRTGKVLFVDGTVWNAADLQAAAMHGGAHSESLYGLSGVADVFDADAGGNDQLYGYGGDDVYWLGRGTGADVIHEHYGNAGDDGDVIRLESGILPSSVRLERSGNNLQVQLLDESGDVSDSLTVQNYYSQDNAKVERVEFTGSAGEVSAVWDEKEFSRAAIRGSDRNESLYGLGNLADVFDADAGGNDQLYGYGGDDVYWLGRGTGADVIHEHYGNAGDDGDVIRLESGIAPSSVRLERLGNNLQVQLLDESGDVSDSLTVQNYYSQDNAKVERVEFTGSAGEVSAVWDEKEFSRAAIRGNDRNESLYGLGNLADVFDADAGGNDQLYGYGGDDVYWLGRGTGADVIHEHYGNAGDDGDVIRLESGIAPSSVRLERLGNNLQVQLLDESGDVSDSLTVQNYYSQDNAKVERVEFTGSAGEVSAVWDEKEFSRAAIRGSARNESLYGLGNLADVFDADAGGNDQLYGYGGDDVYWLGRGTGADVIHEYYGNAGDAGDVIRLESGIVPSSVRLERSGNNLQVQLLDESGDVSDSLTVQNYYSQDNAKVERVEFSDAPDGAVSAVWGADEFALVAIRGGERNESLYGLSGLADVFDADAGGNDQLYGYGGDDVYWLGRGTGADVIHEHYGNAGDDGDVIRLESGILPSSVRLERLGNNLQVQLLDESGDVSDSLTVQNYYSQDNAKVERVEFSYGSDGAVSTVWGADEFALAKIRGSERGESLYGLSTTNDVFDADAGGNDQLYGYGGDDVYWLGRGTGADVIHEHYGNAGDDGDVIRVEQGIGLADIRLRRSGNDLYVDIVGDDGQATDSLRVASHFSDASARVERIEAGGEVLLATQYQQLIDALAVFTAGNSAFADKQALYDHYWNDADALTLPGA